jgi:hypothetical protein
MYIGTALEYAHDGVDLLRPQIVGFNATETPIAQEFPLWQALTALIFRVTDSHWYGWGNLVSLALFFTGVWPFLQLATHYAGARAGWWATVFFLAQPLHVLIAGMAGPDGMALTLTLWFLYFADRLIRKRKWYHWVFAVITGSLLAVTKAPFFFTAGLVSVAFLFLNGWRNLINWGLLASTGALAAAAFYLWTSHANQLAAQAEFPYAEMRFSESAFLQYWYFGDLAYRLSPGNWVRGVWRFLHATLGVLPMVALLVPSLLRKDQQAAKLWLLAGFITTLVFTHVVLEHWHYYLPLAPAVALLCGATLARWEGFWTTELRPNWLRIGFAGMILIFMAVNGLITMRLPIQLDSYARQISQVIREHTHPDDKLIVFTIDQNWGGEELFASGRKGLSVSSLRGGPRAPAPKGLLDILSSPKDLERLKSLGYNKLVLVSESPVRHGIQSTKPGASRPRLLYPQSPETEGFPVVFRSPDLLILHIP